MPEKTTKIGIDLGTSNSCCYCIKGQNNVLPVPMADGSYLLPSVVYYSKDKDPLLGIAVKKHITGGKTTIVRNSKRLIGRRYDCEDVQLLLKSCGAPVINRNGNPVFDLSSIGMEKTPEDIAVDIIQRLLVEARRYTDATVTDVCVTVPARFDNNQRTATLRALKRCGFSDKHVSILSEPSAAAITYLYENENHGDRILVFDFGGGTLDVSIVNIADGNIVVETNRGNNTLGGVDIDQIVLEWMNKEFLKSFHKPLDTKNDNTANGKRRNTFTKLLVKAEEAKICLSTEKTVDISFEGIPGTMTDDGDDSLISLTRATFEKEIKDIVNAALKVVQEALDACHLTKSDICDVVFVGGSTRIPLLRNAVNDYFNSNKVRDGVNPDECVAKGACLSFLRSFVLDDSASYSLGQLVGGGRVQWVIPLDCPLPAKRSEKTIIRNSNMDMVVTYLFQGNSVNKGSTSNIFRQSTSPSSECIPLAPFYYDLSELDDIEGAVIETTFEIKKSGIVYVTVMEERSQTILLDNFKIEFGK